MNTRRKICILASITLLLVACTRYSIDEPVDKYFSLPSITVNSAMLHAETFGPPDSTMVVIIHSGPDADYRGGQDRPYLKYSSTFNHFK
ncbi:MAG: hypothetical protein WA874_17775 [Chryseosolibacter sp.]